MPGVGARTLFALALVAEVVHGAPSRFADPARFSLAHGGKDGHPFPVPLRVYDETIGVLKRAVDRAKLGRADKLHALERLNHQARALEASANGEPFERIVRTSARARPSGVGAAWARRARGQPRASQQSVNSCTYRVSCVAPARPPHSSRRRVRGQPDRMRLPTFSRTFHAIHLDHGRKVGSAWSLPSNTPQAGYRVFATARDRKKPKSSSRSPAHIRLTVHALDASEPQSVAALARDSVGQPLDILLNNAGVMGPKKQSLGNIDYAGMLDTFKVNSIAPLHMAEAFLENVAKGERKLIAALTSGMGSIADSGGGSYAYRASKAALNMSYHNLALDLKESRHHHSRDQSRLGPDGHGRRVLRSRPVRASQRCAKSSTA